MSDIELKPCPFCGGAAKTLHGAFSDYDEVQCQDCFAEALLCCWNSRATPSPQWQPIESAPKDGTAVLVMQNNWPGCKNGVAEECNGHNTYVAAWWADERGGAGAWICYMDAVRDPECPIQPTHWQPLPTTPEVPDGRG
nr:Lar family restriction alleviation protein [Stenotrophomonas pavanii]